MRNVIIWSEDKFAKNELMNEWDEQLDDGWSAVFRGRWSTRWEDLIKRTDPEVRQLLRRTLSRDGDRLLGRRVRRGGMRRWRNEKCGRRTQLAPLLTANVSATTSGGFSCPLLTQSSSQVEAASRLWVENVEESDGNELTESPPVGLDGAIDR